MNHLHKCCQSLLDRDLPNAKAKAKGKYLIYAKCLDSNLIGCVCFVLCLAYKIEFV